MRFARSALALLATTVITVLPVTAQDSPLRAATPAECTKAVAAWRLTQKTAEAYNAYAKASATEKAAALERYNAVVAAANAGANRLSAECAAGFDYATLDPNQLPDLIALYNQAADTVGADRALNHLIGLPGIASRVKGQALQLAMAREIARASDYFGIIDGAERYLAELDRLPQSEDSLKLAAHSTMLGRYEYLDVADGLDQHARAVIALAKKLGDRNRMLSGYSSLARSYADRLHPDSALAVLDGGEIEINDTSLTQPRFKEFRARYALIGTPAKRITGEWWINTDAPLVAPSQGQVTLIEFTAHWCGPCKNSYPGMRSIAERFAGQDFQGVLVTSLYGYLGDRKDLTPEQEVEADRDYFGREHALPYPVAINKTPELPLPGMSYRQPRVDADYLVGGIPQIVIVDKKGIIRQIVTGWDRGNTERFSQFIDRLLQEDS